MDISSEVSIESRTLTVHPMTTAKPRFVPAFLFSLKWLGTSSQSGLILVAPSEHTSA